MVNIPKKSIKVSKWMEKFRKAQKALEAQAAQEAQAAKKVKEVRLQLKVERIFQATRKAV